MNQFRIMLIAGTGDSRKLAAALAQKGYRLVVTTATEYGGSLLEGIPGIEVYSSRLDSSQMARFVEDKAIGCIVDGSHPFAVNVSQNAIRCSEEKGIPYLRYERGSAEAGLENIILVDGFEEAAVRAAKMVGIRAVEPDAVGTAGTAAAPEEAGGYVFLTTGSNSLEIFVKHIEPRRLVVRVLPESRVLEKCEGLGLNASNIIAMKGPFSKEMNVEMFKHHRPAVIVTKDSGREGGTDEKITAARELDIPVIMIRRPGLKYPAVYRTVEEILVQVEDLSPPVK